MSVPPRWRKCPRKGKIIADKFLAFKTPLSTEYDRSLDEQYRFYPSMLLGYVESMGRRMGLVVDLTKTDRYYDKRELMERNVGHHKILCEGYGSAPTPEQVKNFRTICKVFFKDHPGQLIGVHCTHGFNRTGFLISAYLVEEECWGLDAAIASFAVARPPGIYKQHYLDILTTQYSDGGVGDFPAPALPDWCFEEDEEASEGEDDQGAGSGSGMGSVSGKRKTEEENGPSTKKKKFEHDNENAQFAVPVPGVDIVWGPVRKEVQQKCQEILGWEKSGFPGSQPVSMDVQNIGLLNQMPYRVSWKADGTRYLMYIKEKEKVFFVDRDNSVFTTPLLTFPSRKRSGDHIKETLVDSELVVDNDNGVKRPRLLIYDIMQFDGNNDVMKCDHQRRLLCVEKELIQPREEAAGAGTLNKLDEPFSVRFKQFWGVSETRYILERWIPKLTHESDGLIFNPLNDHYEAGRCNHLLKWKPYELNSVDFKLNILRRTGEGMLDEKVGQLCVGGGGMVAELDLKLYKEARKHNGRIVECTLDKSTMKWRFLRVREDKSFPNSAETAKSVYMSIRQPVTKEWLLEVCEKHRYSLGETSNGGVVKNSHGNTDMPPPSTGPLRSTR